MKTPCGTFRVATLAAIAVGALLSIRAFAERNPEPTEPPKSQATFVLKIKNATRVKDTARFEDILKHLKTQLYDIVIREEDGTQKHLVPGSSVKLDIKTDKVTTSEGAENSPTGHTRMPGHTHMASQPGVMRQIASMYSSDINTVVNEMQ
jgi:hypothetical protein